MVRVLKYNRAKMDILQTIVAHKLQVGDRLPSLREFLSESDFSAITLRRAMDDLEQQGIITKQQGTGSFLNKNINGTAMLGKVLFINVYRYYPNLGFEQRELKKFFMERGFALDISSSTEPGGEITGKARECAGIFVSGWLTRVWVDYLKAFNVPVMVIGANPFPEELPGVDWNLPGGIGKLTAKLIEDGSKCFAVLPGGKEYHTSMEIKQGFQNEIQRRGLNPDDHPLFTSEGILRYTHEDILAYFRKHPNIDTLLLGQENYQVVLELLRNGALPDDLRLGVICVSPRSRFPVRNTYFLIFEGNLYRDAAEAFWNSLTVPDSIRAHIGKRHCIDQFTIIKPTGG